MTNPTFSMNQRLMRFCQIFTLRIDRNDYEVPFVCIAEGATIISTNGEAGTGHVIHAVKHTQTIHSQIKAMVGNQLHEETWCHVPASTENCQITTLLL